MSFNPDLRHLQLLENRLEQQLTLLDELTEAMETASGPLERRRFRNDAKNTQEIYEKTRTEYEQIKARTTTEIAVPLQTVAEQLKEMDAKLTVIQSDIGELKHSEQTTILLLMKHLNAEQVATTQSLYQALDTQAMIEEPLSQDLTMLSTALVTAEQTTQQAGKPLPPEVQEAIRVIASPDVEVKHKLKVSIPLIPFILSYEGELGLNVKASLQAAYDRLKQWRASKAAPQNPP